MVSGWKKALNLFNRLTLIYPALSFVGYYVMDKDRNRDKEGVTYCTLYY